MKPWPQSFNQKARPHNTATPGYTTGGSGSRRQASPSTDLTRSSTAAASALADMFSPPKPQAPIPSPTSMIGQGAARTMTPWVAEAIAPAVNTMNQFMQQAEDEGWFWKYL